jgi:hypothetical protein
VNDNKKRGTINKRRKIWWKIIKNRTLLTRIRIDEEKKRCKEEGKGKYCSL